MRRGGGEEEERRKRGGREEEERRRRGGEGSVTTSLQEHYDNFFEDVFVECEDKYGQVSPGLSWSFLSLLSLSSMSFLSSLFFLLSLLRGSQTVFLSKLKILCQEE